MEASNPLSSSEEYGSQVQRSKGQCRDSFVAVECQDKDSFSERAQQHQDEQHGRANDDNESMVDENNVNSNGKEDNSRGGSKEAEEEEEASSVDGEDSYEQEEETSSSVSSTTAAAAQSKDGIHPLKDKAQEKIAVKEEEEEDAAAEATLLQETTESGVEEESKQKHPEEEDSASAATTKMAAMQQQETTTRDAQTTILRNIQNDIRERLEQHEQMKKHKTLELEDLLREALRERASGKNYAAIRRLKKAKLLQWELDINGTAMTTMHLQMHSLEQQIMKLPSDDDRDGDQQLQEIGNDEKEEYFKAVDRILSQPAPNIEWDDADLLDELDALLLKQEDSGEKQGDEELDEHDKDAGETMNQSPEPLDNAAEPLQETAASKDGIESADKELKPPAENESPEKASLDTKAAGEPLDEASKDTAKVTESSPAISDSDASSSSLKNEATGDISTARVDDADIFVDQGPPPSRLIFGSCNFADRENRFWPLVKARRPAGFIWGGDSVYGDHRNPLLDWKGWFPPQPEYHCATPETMKDMFHKQRSNPGYRDLVNDPNITIFGTIDDHDYGCNNADRTFAHGREIGSLFVSEFLGHDKDSLMLQRARQGYGVYGVALFDFSRPTGHEFVPPDQAMLDPDYDNGIPIRQEQQQPQQKDDANKLRDLDLVKENALDSSQPQPKQQRRRRWLRWLPWNRKKHLQVQEQEEQHRPKRMRKQDKKKRKNAYKYSNKTVAVFVLDVRTNKDPWRHGWDALFQDRDRSGDFLGTQQWIWLEQALSRSQATVNIIVTGLQVHSFLGPDANYAESWSHFPQAQERLYNTILNSGAAAPVLISGDVHMAQFFRKDCMVWDKGNDSDAVESKDAAGRKNVGKRGKKHPRDTSQSQHTPPAVSSRPLLEMTTSGMTHSWGAPTSALMSSPSHTRAPLNMWGIYCDYVKSSMMHILHWVSAWTDMLVSKRELQDKPSGDGSERPTLYESGGGEGAKQGLQYTLLKNIGELEFDWEEQTLTMRVLGDDFYDTMMAKMAVNKTASPLLMIKMTMDQLSGKTPLPDGYVTSHDFQLQAQALSSPAHQDSSPILKPNWVCVNYRGFAGYERRVVAHFIAAGLMLVAIPFPIVFLPIVLLLVLRRRRQQSRKKFQQKKII